MKNADLFRRENEYADFDAEGAVSRLSRAIRFDTTGYVDTARIRYEQFDALHDFLRSSYPHVMAAGHWEEIGHSMLITLPGGDSRLRPALFMAHQDVVPVIPGTEGKWLHPPFSGDVAEGYIWGRGAMDIKQMLIGILESAEYLLSRGSVFRRTVYLAFGEDEETRSTGARAISDTLKRRGVELEFVLDEGAGDVTNAADYGAPGTLVCPIGVYESGAPLLAHCPRPLPPLWSSPQSPICRMPFCRHCPPSLPRSLRNLWHLGCMTSVRTRRRSWIGFSGTRACITRSRPQWLPL